MVVTIIDEGQEVRIPSWVNDPESFSRWLDEVEFPEEWRIWWLCGEVYIDMSREQIFTHVLVKTKITVRLGLLVEQEQSGIYLTDGALLSNFAADMVVKPDGLFVSAETLASDRVRLIEGKERGFVELQGSPDMVLEILSDGSVQKDTVLLKKAYFEAGIREYWLVDAREEPIQFDIFRATTKGYSRTPRQSGWVKSSVFDRSFQLTVSTGLQGHPSYTLDMR